MPLPNPDQAAIDPSKVRDYLLSTTHPLGRFKAAFFRSLGYEAANWQVLAADLRAQHLPLEPRDHQDSAFGRKYVIRGSLQGPTGQKADVVSVWIVLADEAFARLVTVYPEGSR